MSKIKFLMMAVLFLGLLSFVSCGKDNDKEPEDNGGTNNGVVNKYLGDISVIEKTASSLTLEVAILNASEIEWINCGFCWVPASSGDEVTKDNNPVDFTPNAGDNKIHGTIHGLHANTEYKVRAYIACAETTYYSPILTVGTEADNGGSGEPSGEVVINFEELKSPSGGALYFKIVASNVTAPPTEAGLCYIQGKGGEPTIVDACSILYSNNQTTEGVELSLDMEHNAGTVTGTLDGFESGNYVFRPYLKYESEVIYGESREVNIKEPIQASISIANIDEISASGFNFVINVIADQQPPRAGFCYSTRKDLPTIEDQTMDILPQCSNSITNLNIQEGNPIAVTGTVTGLDHGIRYYFRPYMWFSETNIVYGDVQEVSILDVK